MSKGVAFSGFKDQVTEDAFKDYSEWAEVLDLTDPGLHGLINQLAERNCPIPEPGFELIDEKGEIVAEAELGWIEKKVAFLLSHQIEFSPLFKKAGWKSATIDDVLNDLENYISLLSE